MVSNGEEARERIGWNLVFLARMYRRELDWHLREFGLSEAATLPLRYLGTFEQGIRQGQLAHALSLEGPTLVALIDQLEKQRLVERIRDPLDKRVRQIVLTQAGRDLNTALQAKISTVRKQIFVGIGEDDLACCARVLDNIDQNLRDRNSWEEGSR